MVRSKAFTLIELLVVVLIIMILLGLLIPGFDILRTRALRAQAQTTLTTVVMAIRAAGASNARQASGAEHPLAASIDPRLNFVRANDGSAVATVGEAYKVTDETWASIGSTAVPPNQVLRPEDIFADPRFPAFFGMQRSTMRILSSTNQWITRYRELPNSPSAADLTKSQWLYAPTLQSWKDGGFERITITDASSPAWENAVAQTMNALLTSHYDTLLDMGALHSFSTSEGSLDVHNRLVIPDDDELIYRRAIYAGQFVKDDQILNYRLRGTALYDPWGGEILVSFASNGVIKATSAGPSGLFAWHPGDNGVFDTPAHATAASGDDKDGRLDNISVGDSQ